jgi:hypothetical protein
MTSECHAGFRFVKTCYSVEKDQNTGCRQVTMRKVKVLELNFFLLTEENKKKRIRKTQRSRKQALWMEGGGGGGGSSSLRHECLFTVYLTMLSVAVTPQRHTVDRLLNTEFERIWKGTIVVCHLTPSRHLLLLSKTTANPKVGVQVEIRREYFHNTSHNIIFCYMPLDFLSSSGRFSFSGRTAPWSKYMPLGDPMVHINQSTAINILRTRGLEKNSRKSCGWRSIKLDVNVELDSWGSSLAHRSGVSVFAMCPSVDSLTWSTTYHSPFTKREYLLSCPHQPASGQF